MIDYAEYFQEVNRLLTEKYCMNFDDTGYDKGEWLDRFGGLNALEAVLSYGDKYDLTLKTDIVYR